MPSPFFETPLQSLLVWHQVDTVVITGGSTSGCVRAAAVDSLSRGYRTIVPEQCVADKHESYALRQPDRPDAQVRRRGRRWSTYAWQLEHALQR
jgi:nicotinamidase-related amidase